MTLPCDSSDDIDTLLVDDRVGRVRFHGASFLDTFRARCFPCNGGGIRTVSPSRTGVCTHTGAAVSSAAAAWPWLLLSSPPSTGVCKRSMVGAKSSKPLLLASSSWRTTFMLPSALTSGRVRRRRGVSVSGAGFLRAAVWRGGIAVKSCNVHYGRNVATFCASWMAVHSHPTQN